MGLFFRGLVIKNASEANLLHRSLFAKRFGTEKIPSHWEVSAALRIAPDASRPSGYCITARAAENAHIGEVVFIVAAAKMYTDNPIRVLEALCADMRIHLMSGLSGSYLIWLNRGAGNVLQVAAQKMNLYLNEFTDEATACRTAHERIRRLRCEIVLTRLEAAIGIEPKVLQKLTGIVHRRPQKNKEIQNNTLDFFVFVLGLQCMQVFTTIFTTVVDASSDQNKN